MLKKRDAKKQEALTSLAKKFKQMEQRLQEETQVSVELKKRHDVMLKKLEVAGKAKVETNKQLKQLFVIFTKQRKALELSIKKNKKFEFEIENHNRIVNEFQK